MLRLAMNYLLPHVRAGKLRALGVTTAKRVEAVPRIPGLSGFESVQWYGLLAPAKTPSGIINKIHKEVVSFLGTPATVARLVADGNQVAGSSPEAFSGFMKGETTKWAKVVKAAGRQPE
ncbi:MAG: hypothetical protein GEV05_28075 [Betaproteobacteria bacterium]|nr:hypothetical protein [Betaproteobacteria bacterium]